MEKRAGRVKLTAVTVLLVLTAALFFGGRVLCETEVPARELEEYYREKEQELVREVREFLRSEGYENSGIMVTRVVEDDGRRLYTVTVHHGRIDSMDAGLREELLDHLQELNFADDNCSFVHQFLLDE